MIRVWNQSVKPREFTEGFVRELDKLAPNGRFPIYNVSAIGRFSEVTVEIESRHPPADFFYSGTFFMVSEGLKQELENFQVPGEFFPVNMVYKGKPYTDKRYYFANIMDEVDCLDEINGKYTYWNTAKGTIEVDKIIRLVIDESKAAGHHLFFVSRLSGLIFFACQELQDSIRQKGFTGIAFNNPENVHLMQSDY